MSVSLAFKQSLIGRSPQERLSNVLKKHRNRFKISKDGFINMDLQSEEVQEAIEKQLIKLGNIHVHVGKVADK